MSRMKWGCVVEVEGYVMEIRPPCGDTNSNVKDIMCRAAVELCKDSRSVV